MTATATVVRQYIPGHPGMFVSFRRNGKRYEYFVHRADGSATYGASSQGSASSLREIMQKAKASLRNVRRDPASLTAGEKSSAKAARRGRARPGNPRGLEVGDAVQFRSSAIYPSAKHFDPSTASSAAGVIQRFEANAYLESQGNAWVMTSAGLRKVPTHALRLRRAAAKLRDPGRRRARDPRAVAVNESKKGDLVTFEYRGFRVSGRVRRVLKNGTRTVEVTAADPGFERHMAQSIDEGIMVDVRH